MAEPLQLILHPWLQIYDPNGQALAGGKVWTYEAGTTTPLVTYSDSEQTVPNTNPVILDAEGKAPLYVTGPWKMVVQYADGAQLRTHDDLIGITSDVVALISGNPEFVVHMESAAGLFLSQNFASLNF